MHVCTLTHHIQVFKVVRAFYITPSLISLKCFANIIYVYSDRVYMSVHGNRSTGDVVCDVPTMHKTLDLFPGIVRDIETGNY